jgi:hypothetical protein
MRFEGKLTADVPAILKFIQEEVVRQGFSLGERKGLVRVGWMIEAWSYALLNQGEKLDKDHLLRIGEMIERRNIRGFRRCGVRVGGHVAPSFLEVPQLIDELFRNFRQDPAAERCANTRNSADKFYLEFQRIHPFVDGNGRTGKIIHNWILGTLADPVLIKDYFGGGNP